MPVHSIFRCSINYLFSPIDQSTRREPGEQHYRMEFFFICAANAQIHWLLTPHRISAMPSGSSSLLYHYYLPPSTATISNTMKIKNMLVPPSNFFMGCCYFPSPQLFTQLANTSRICGRPLFFDIIHRHYPSKIG